MNRQSQLLYLQNIRDIEVALYCLKNKHQEEEEDYRIRLDELQTVFYLDPPTKVDNSEHIGRVIIAGIISLALLAAAYLLFTSPMRTNYAGITTHGVRFFSWVFLIVFLIAAAITIGFIAIYIQEHREYKIKTKDMILHNNQERKKAEENSVKISELKRNWDKRNAWYKEEMGKLNHLREEFYDMNIIPLPFRNISAICYIHDYMATSRESLTTALFGRHIEDGILRIEAKLDAVVSSLQTLIYETRCQRQQSECIIEQNNRMLVCEAQCYL